MKTTFPRTTGLAAAALALGGLSAGASAAEYATVVSATPITTSSAVPRQECFQSEQLVQPQTSGAGAVIGAIAGGVIGNQFGHGFGRAAATGLGAIAGSAIGNHAEANANPPAAVPVQRCRTVTGYEQRIVGYDVVYEYHGQRYSTRLPHDPGARLAIDVRPLAGSAPVERVAPRTSYGAVPYASHGAVAPATVDVAPAYVEAAPVTTTTVYTTAPVTYAPAAVYYDSPARYIAPAIIGAGIGYWIGNTWHRGHRWHGHRGDGHRWHGHRR